MTANKPELSRRFDDVHKWLDDLRGDMNLRFGELREGLIADLIVRSGERWLMADG